jgi:hypothetical protein
VSFFFLDSFVVCCRQTMMIECKCLKTDVNFWHNFRYLNCFVGEKKQSDGLLQRVKKKGSCKIRLVRKSRSTLAQFLVVKEIQV